MTDLKKLKEETKKPKCAKCNGSLVYIRIKDNSLVCRSCGHIENLGEKVDG